MILIGSQLEARLNQPDFKVRPFLIMGVGAQEYDLSDRVHVMSQTASLDSPTMAFSATLERGSGVESLSPYITASQYTVNSPLPGRPIADPNVQVEMGFEIGTQFGDDYQRILTLAGRVDRVNAAAGNEQLVIQGRDKGATLANRFIERERPYGSEAGVPVEDVIRSIWADNEVGGFFLDVPLSPGYMISPAYGQTEMSLMEASRILVQQIGWDLRFFASLYSSSGATQHFRLYQPQRDAFVQTMTLAQNRYDKVEELAVGDEDVRNVWEVWYPDASVPIRVRDDISVSRYGLRYARIGLDRTANIRTEAAAQGLADAALADSKDPFASHRISARILPQVELNDIHLYEANGREYDTDFTGAVVAFTHSYQNGHATTTIGTRQTAVAAYREYRRSKLPKQITSSIAPPETFYAEEGTRWTHVPDLGVPQVALS